MHKITEETRSEAVATINMLEKAAIQEGQWADTIKWISHGLEGNWSDEELNLYCRVARMISKVATSIHEELCELAH